MIETITVDEIEKKATVATVYDSSAVIRLNRRQRDAAPDIGRYRGKKLLYHVARIHEGDVVRLKNMGYNLLTSDPDEKRRCLLYIQQNEPWLMTVPGKPIAGKKQAWV